MKLFSKKTNFIIYFKNGDILKLINGCRNNNGASLYTTIKGRDASGRFKSLIIKKSDIKKIISF